MITIEKTFPGTIAYPLERLGDPEKLVFFDIETTGFSAGYNTVYLIGCIWPEGESRGLDVKKDEFFRVAEAL